MENLCTKIHSVKGNFQQPFFMEIFTIKIWKIWNKKKSLKIKVTLNHEC